MAPGSAQGLAVVADHVDHGLDDILRPRALSAKGRQRVGCDLVELRVEVTGANQRPGLVERAPAWSFKRSKARRHGH